MNANYDSDAPERDIEGQVEEPADDDDSNNADQDRDDEDEEVSSDEGDDEEDDEIDEDINEDNGDIDDDDSDEGGSRDREIVSRIIHFLAEGARSSEWIWIARYEELDIMSLLNELTDHGMDNLLKAVKGTSSWDHLVKQLVVDLTDPDHDLIFALRVTQILDCLHLTSLEQFDILWFEDLSFDDDNLQLWKPSILDHYVKWIATTTCIARPGKLSKFCLGGLGADPRVWGAFVARFSSLREVELTLAKQAGELPNGAVCATAFAASMRRLPLLRTLKIEVCVAGLSSMVTGLARGLKMLRSLQTVSLFFEPGRDSDNVYTQDSHVVLDEFCRGLALCSSLKDVRVMFNNGASRYIRDFGALFDHLRTSGSIEKLELRCVDISSLQVGHSGGEPESSITNQSLKSLVLNDCSIGRSYSSVLANFVGVETISLKWHEQFAKRPWRSPKTWAMLFRALPQLKSIVVGNVEYAPASIDEEGVLAALVASLDLAGSVLQDWTVCTNSCPRNNQSVPLPSLEHLLSKSSGKLTLRHGGIDGSTCESLCAGLRDTPFLTNLELIVHGEAMTHRTVTSILASLQENRSVKAFRGKLLFDSPMEVEFLGPVLMDLLSTNSVLESFGLELLVRRRLGYDSMEGDTPPNYAELIVAPVANALPLNRSLRILYLNGLERVDPVSFSALSGMLKTNVTLERIIFHDSVEAYEGKDKIEWLLTLNRYKRRCLFLNHDLARTLIDDRTPVGRDDPNPRLLLPGGVQHVLPPAADEDPRPAVSDPDSLPAGVWSAVLERIATDRRADVMYHFLRRTPKSLFVSSSLPPRPQRQSVRGLKRTLPWNQNDDEDGDDDDGVGSVSAQP